MIFLALIQLMFIVTITYYEYKNKSPMVFLWATLLLMFGVMHVISYILPGYQYADTLDEASWFVILFCVLYSFFRYFSRKVMLRLKVMQHVQLVSDERLLLWGEALLFISVLLYGYFVISSSGSLVEVNKENVYLTMAKESKFFLLSTYLYYATAPLLLYCLIKRRKKDTFFVMALILIRALLSSSRMDMIIIFVGIIGYIIFNAKKKSIKSVAILGVLGIIALIAIYALRTFRYYYSFSSITSVKLSEFIRQMLEFVKNDDGELGLRKVFYYFIQHDNQFEGFGSGNGYKRVLMLMIPSGLTGGLKPEDMCAVMGRAWKPEFIGIITYTVTPTLFGDCYANFGFWGFLMGGIWGAIGTLMDLIANRKNEILKYLLWGVIATEFIDIGRGSVYNPLCLIWYCGIIISILYFIRRFKFGKKHRIVIKKRY